MTEEGGQTMVTENNVDSFSLFAPSPGCQPTRRLGLRERSDFP